MALEDYRKKKKILSQEMTAHKFSIQLPFPSFLYFHKFL
jgi:hypothetical protein